MTLFDYDIIQAKNMLECGGIILYPTDTVWGIGCDAANDEAIEKIIQLKNTNNRTGFIVLVSDIKMLKNYVKKVSPKILDFISTANKPTTVIYEYKKGLSPKVVSADGTVAFRICNNDFCKTLITKFGKPIVSTSANFSSEPTPKNFKAIDKRIVDGVDYGVSYSSDDESEKLASQLIKLEKDKIVVVRK